MFSYMTRKIWEALVFYLDFSSPQQTNYGPDTRNSLNFGMAK